MIQLKTESSPSSFPFLDRLHNQNIQFLIGGLIFVLILTFIKAETPVQGPIKTVLMINKTETPALPSRRFPLHSTLYRLSTHTFALTEDPILVGHFRQFIETTHYRTVREKLKITPTWREAPDDSPVLWLNRSDAEAFCRWLAIQAKSLSPYDNLDPNQPMTNRLGFRLPTTTELDQSELQLPENQWIWTCNDLDSFDRSLHHASDYLTAWQSPKRLKHRRPQDTLRQEEDPIGFYVAWTVH